MALRGDGQQEVSPLQHLEERRSWDSRCGSAAGFAVAAEGVLVAVIPVQGMRKEPHVIVTAETVYALAFLDADHGTTSSVLDVDSALEVAAVVAAAAEVREEIRADRNGWSAVAEDCRWRLVVGSSRYWAQGLDLVDQAQVSGRPTADQGGRRHSQLDSVGGGHPGERAQHAELGYRWLGCS